MSVEAETYLEEKKRYFTESEPGYLNQRLINIDIQHTIIPDELHLLLRVTDRMIENLINGAVAYDDVSNILEGAMLKRLIAEIRSCGVVFNIIVRSKNTRDFTSLTGTEKKKLLKFLPSKIPPDCQPDDYAQKVTELWEVSNLKILHSYFHLMLTTVWCKQNFADLYTFISSATPPTAEVIEGLVSRRITTLGL